MTTRAFSIARDRDVKILTISHDDELPEDINFEMSRECRTFPIEVAEKIATDILEKCKERRAFSIARDKLAVLCQEFGFEAIMSALKEEGPVKD